MMHRFILLGIVMLVGTQVFSQQSAEAYRRLADSLYRYQNYEDAAVYYQRALKHAPDSAAVMLCVANAYSEINRVNESTLWYAKAVAARAVFQEDDTYRYIYDLLKLERQSEAETLLRAVLKKKPDDAYALTLLDHILKQSHYWVDSADYVVTPLTVLNTPVPEFAPVYYKQGLLFTSARSEGSRRKKFHWDNSYFLHLYYAPLQGDDVFGKPTRFSNKLHSIFHEGPVSVYDQDQRMIINQNIEGKVMDSADVYVSQLALAAAAFNEARKTWEVQPLPFRDEAYSFLHPHISEDGNTLFFASDMPGGYGGMDLYITTRQEGQWRKPLNVGAGINTAGDEVFPYYVDHTLYFASDGHGGLGELDLFKSMHTPNGFIFIQNLGAPINSHRDDFSLITKDHRHGFFASSRNGNDDLFSFRRQLASMTLRARIVDGETAVSLPGAEIEVLTAEDDLTMVAEEGGLVAFDLPETSAYMLIARLGDKVGTMMGMADLAGDGERRVHEVRIYADTAGIVCVGTLKDENGRPRAVKTARIVDETTGEEIASGSALAMVSFQGKPGHAYRVEVTDEQGQFITRSLEIAADAQGPNTWDMQVASLPDSVTLHIHVMEETRGLPVSGAHVTVTALAQPDQEAMSGEAGLVQAVVPRDATYMVTAYHDQDEDGGMTYGFAEVAPGEHSKHDTIWINRPRRPPVHGMVLVADVAGNILKDARITITNNRTGLSQVRTVSDGGGGFFSEYNASYTIQVERAGYETEVRTVTTTEQASEKIPVVLQAAGPIRCALQYRFVTADSTPVAGAQVALMTFSNPHGRYLADAEGMLSFTVPDGEFYVISAEKDGLAGTFSGMALQDTTSVLHTLVLQQPQQDSALAVTMIKNQRGEVIQLAEVEVTDTQTGQAVAHTFENGLLTFPSLSGREYKLAVAAENYEPVTETVAVDSLSALISLKDIQMIRRVPVSVSITDPTGETIDQAKIDVRDVDTGEVIPARLDAGELTFTGLQNKAYRVNVTHPAFAAASDKILIPRQADTVAVHHIRLMPGIAPMHTMAARVITSADSLPVAQALVTMITFVADDVPLLTNDAGRIDFTLAEGTPYMLKVAKGDYAGLYTGICMPEESAPAMVHQVVVDRTPQDHTMVVATVTDEAGAPIAAADMVVTDRLTGHQENVEVINGFVIFPGKKGTHYGMAVKAKGYSPGGMEVPIDTAVTDVAPVNIKLHAIPQPPPMYSLTAQVVSAADQQPLPSTRVKMISFVNNDQLLVADAEGRITFTLAEGTPYMLQVDEADYQGIYTGIAMREEASSEMTHTVFVDPVQEDHSLVVAIVSNEAGDLIPVADMVITNRTTGQQKAAEVINGFMTFPGKRGSQYGMAVTAKGYSPGAAAVPVDTARVSPAPVRITLRAIPEPLPTYTLAARVITAFDRQPLPGASVTMMSFVAPDQQFTADQAGRFDFTLTEGTPYMLKVSQGDYQGIYTGIAMREEASTEMIHDVWVAPVDKEYVMIMTMVTDEQGTPMPAAHMIITDQQTNARDTVEVIQGFGMFSGKKGVNYRLTVDAPGYVSKELTIPVAIDAEPAAPMPIALRPLRQPYQFIPPPAITPEAQVPEAEPETTSPATPSYAFTAQVVQAASLQPVEAATVKMITFVADDVALVSNAEGKINFTLPEGTPYMLKVQKGDAYGMYTGIAMEAEASTAMLHKITIDQAAPDHTMVITTVTDEAGAPIASGDMIITDRETGRQETVEVINGFVIFPGKKGTHYGMTVKAPGYSPGGMEVPIDTAVTELAPVNMMLHAMPQPPPVYSLTAQVVSASDHQPLAAMPVRMISFIQNDQVLTTDETGHISFTLPEGTPYMLQVNGQQYQGIYTGISMQAESRNEMTHMVFAEAVPEDHSMVVAIVSDEAGELIPAADMLITNRTTGQQKATSVINGFMTFPGKRGSQYGMAVTAKGYSPAAAAVPIDTARVSQEPVRITLHAVPQPLPTYTLAARVLTASDHQPLPGAQVTLLSLDAGPKQFTADADARFNFTLTEGTSYMLQVRQGDYQGIYTGIAMREEASTEMTHEVLMTPADKDRFMVMATVTDEQGAPIPAAEMMITDTQLAREEATEVIYGFAMFSGKRGTDYRLAVNAPDYVYHVTALAIKDTATAVAPVNIVLRPLRQPYLSVPPVTPPPVMKPTDGYTLAARIVTAADRQSMPGATVKVITFTSADTDLVSNDAGMVDFNLPTGTPYLLNVSKGDYQGVYTGIAMAEESSTAMVHEVAVEEALKDRLLVVTRVTDESGTPVPAATVVVTDQRTGEAVNADVVNGFMMFSGKQGEDYAISITAPGYAPATTTLAVPTALDMMDPIDITLQSIQPSLRTQKLQVVRASNQTPVAGAAVRVIGFAQEEIETESDATGGVQFTMPAGEPYVAVVQDDAFFGLYTALEATAQIEATPVPTLLLEDEAAGRVPVIGWLLDDDNGQPVSPAEIMVSDHATGDTLAVEYNQGLILFAGQQGHDYDIEITSEGYDTQQEHLTISPTVADVQEIEFPMRRRKLLMLPPTATLVQTNEEIPRFYIADTDSYDEVIEADGQLYLTQGNSRRLLGKGSLADFAQASSRPVGMHEDQFIRLANLYFDFNSATLDTTDEAQLDRTVALLQRYPHLQLAVNTHADTRGSQHYNMQLTRRRAKAVRRYLQQQGISSRRLAVHAYGKSTPAVVCATAACSEAQHQKNRRAEFALAMAPKQAEAIASMPIVKSPTVVRNTAARTRVSGRYASILRKYGDRRKAGLVFTVCIGAYRYNPTLTFPEFDNLGTVERRERQGIHYYYLRPYATMNEAEAIRQQVILGGVADAYITIFYEDALISFAEFIRITSE